MSNARNLSGLLDSNGDVNTANLDNVPAGVTTLGGLSDASTTATNNLGLGTGAVDAITTGAYNIGIGDYALTTNTEGVRNTATGYASLYANTTGSYNTASGYASLYANTTGGDNVAVGSDALYTNTTGSNNTASGKAALYWNTTGDSNTASGHAALHYNTTGGYNTASGRLALVNNTTGLNNTALGYVAGDNITTGSSNIIIGAHIDAPSATASNQLNIGNALYGDGKRLWAAGNNASNTWHRDIMGTVIAVGVTSNTYLQIKVNISTSANKMFDFSVKGRTHYTPNYINCGLNGYAYGNASALWRKYWKGASDTQGGVIDAYRTSDGYIAFTISVPAGFNNCWLEVNLSGGGNGGYGQRVDLLQWVTLSSNYHYL